MSGIVIIEDDELIHALLKEYLSEAGYLISSAGSADTAATPDVVITDVYMPRSTGMEKLQAIRAAHPGTPLIAISGQFCSGLASCRATADALGVKRIIAKPFSRDELLEAVRHVIGSPDKPHV
ncbi:MAG TPA: response regulator [Burkholderiales bacterium]|jgi:DNA-binding response OmpR family regulator|nr:response regulator [Burkholderiales bacterium]